MPIKRRVSIVAVVCLALAAGCGAGDESVPVQPAAPRIADSVADHLLLQDALTVWADVQGGHSGLFAHVPEKQPPGLVRMIGIKDGNSDIDTYVVGDPPLHVVVRFGPHQRDACTTAEPSPGGPVCVPRQAHDDVSVYLSGDGEAGSQRFWSRTEMVPIAAAAWFTRLVERAEAAPLK